jgi:formylglycine-generating enzyme
MSGTFFKVFPLSSAILAAAWLASGCSSSSVRSAASQDPHREMHWIPSGTFQMGDSTLAKPVHQVSVSSFYMDTTPVTQEKYQMLMKVNPSAYTGDPRHPVETVTWFDAVLFCNARSKAEGLDTVYSFSSISGTPGDGCSLLGDLEIRFNRKGYRLPTEAEWEYAYRAGTTTMYYWGDTVDGNYCWYFANCEGTMHPVAQKLPNAFGLYDMAGILWEWCNDWYAAYDAGAHAQTDPTGPLSGTYRVARGGCWYIYYLPILSAGFRYYYLPNLVRFYPPENYCGFRCVLPAN